jgi:hypothetical protein
MSDPVLLEATRFEKPANGGDENSRDTYQMKVLSQQIAGGILVWMATLTPHSAVL